MSEQFTKWTLPPIYCAFVGLKIVFFQFLKLLDMIV